MNFEHSAKAKEIIERVQQFMDAHIFPLEKEYLKATHHGNPDFKNWDR
jgi:acyl-CoA dehydrogenase